MPPGHVVVRDVGTGSRSCGALLADGWRHATAPLLSMLVVPAAYLLLRRRIIRGVTRPTNRRDARRTTVPSSDLNRRPGTTEVTG